MTEETNEEIKPTETEETKPTEISNSDLKANSTFQKVTGELAQLRAEKEEREAETAKRKSEAEAQKLEAEGNYKEALALRDKQLEETKTAHSKEILQRDLKLELSNAGFKNKIFVNGAIADFQGTNEEVASYVETLAKDESNSVFLGTQQRGTLPEAKPPSNGAAPMSVEQAQTAKESKDPEVRLKAYSVLEAHINKHGSLP